MDAVSDFISQWLRRDSAIEGILLSPDMVYIVITSMINSLKLKDIKENISTVDPNYYKNQIAFVGGTYVEHLSVINAVGISISFINQDYFC